jgi:hypothetical protein
MPGSGFDVGLHRTSYPTLILLSDADFLRLQTLHCVHACLTHVYLRCISLHSRALGRRSCSAYMSDTCLSAVYLSLCKRALGRRSYYYMHQLSEEEAAKEVEQEEVSREKGIELYWRINTEVFNISSGLVRYPVCPWTTWP